MNSYDLTKDFDFILQDRIEVIKLTNQRYDLENNSYISFSGGKDSTVLSKLIDVALPNNNIPRVFIDTGIEFEYIREFVNKLAETDKRFVIVKPSKPIKHVLEKYGYPFKSKQHSHNVNIYQNNKEITDSIIKEINNNKRLLNEYEYIKSLPKGVKTNVKYIYGVRERERTLYLYQGLP